MMENYLLLLTTIVWTILSGVAAQTTSFQPECNAWDGAIVQIQKSLKAIGGSATCTKSADCTGLSCTMNFWGQSMTIDTKLYPCDIPPQMRLLVRSPTVNFEQTVTHGDVYSLPGLTYVPFRMLPSFKLAVVLVVHFQIVPNGLRIGICLETRGFGTAIGWPLMPDTIVPTAPCPTEPAAPSNTQCTKMDQLLTTMAPPQGFLCAPTGPCDGFSCAGNIGFLGILSYDLNATLVVNSCDSPISYTVSLFSKDASLNYKHKFTHSDSVPVTSAGMPPGTASNLTVTMRPSINLDSIDTSVQISTCIAPMVFLNPSRECHQAPLLVNQPVPIPPCETPQLPTVVNPPQPLMAAQKAPSTGVDAECDAWDQIEQSMTQASISGYGFDRCNRDLDCKGMTCHAVYDGNNYELVMELYHCAVPPTLLVKVDSTDANFHFAKNVTSNTTVTISKDMAISLRMHPVEGGVLLGGTLKSTILGGIPIELPIIKDRVVPTPPCDGVTSRPGVEPTAPPVRPMKTRAPTRTDTQGGTNPNLLGDVTTDSNNEAPRQDPVQQKGVNGMIVGFGVGFAAFFTIILVGTIYYFSRRHTRGRQSDEVVLVGDNGTSDA